MKINNRLNSIGEYHFKKIDEIKYKLESEGINVINLGIGDPDLPTDNRILDALIQGFNSKDFNKYPPYDGIRELKVGIINYYKKVYGVKLKEDEVVILIGSKEGISNLIPAVCDFKDYALIPDPAYPVYEICSKLWGVETYKFPLTKNSDYLPKLEFIPQNIVRSSKLIVINYPNNPTGAVANHVFYKEIIKFAEKNNIVLCNDGAYNEIIEENKEPLSLMQFDYKKRCIEFGSFSKTYNMTGFRLGYAVGNREIIKALIKIKSNVDSGQFIPIQLAGIEALKIKREYINGIRSIYDERRKIVENILNNKNISFFRTKGTFYLWCKVPRKYSTNEFCEELLRDNKIIVTPGSNFGSLGDGYFRISLTTDKKILAEAINKIKKYE